MDAERTTAQPDLGARIKALRLASGQSLAQLAAIMSMSEATLSRIENGLSDITAKNLYALATALNVKIGEFFTYESSAAPVGLRSITRAGHGLPFRSGTFRSELLAPDLSSKKMNPFVNTSTARTIQQAGGLNAHAGEEFLLVLEGILVLHTEHYQPLTLRTGDSIYFDASMQHAYVSADDSPVRFLVVTSDLTPLEEV